MSDFGADPVSAAPEPKLGKKPGVHSVTRAHIAAADERSTINLRPPKFFELALPVLSGEHGERIYPPASATLRLASHRGYRFSYSVSAGMVTDDGFCSFRFYDISEKASDELFTATLEHGEEKEVIFRDRRVATYIQAARNAAPYETAFSPVDEPSADSQHDELLAPVGASEGD